MTEPVKNQSREEAAIESCFAPLIGNAGLKRYFIAELKNRSLSHAYILEGPKGSGRRTLAACVLTALAGDSPFAFKIREGNSPDVTVYSVPDQKKTIGVDTIRRIKSDAYVKPNELEFRAFLLDDAHRMTVSAQNAALKILEEPPKDVYFFLLCESAGLLLPTVRSRATTLRMERFEEDTLRDICHREPSLGLQKAHVEKPTLFENALRRADGRIGHLLLAFRGEGSGQEKQHTLARKHSSALLSAALSRDLSGIISAAQALPSVREDLDTVLEHFERMLRDLMLIHSLGEERAVAELSYFVSVKEARDCGGRASDRTLLLLRDRVSDAREKLSLNANIGCLKTSLGAELYKASRL